MRKYVLYIVILLSISACTMTVSSDHFAMISSRKNITKFEIESQDVKNIKTNICYHQFLFFPLSERNDNISEVVTNEINKYNAENNTSYNVIVNTNITRKITIRIIVDSSCVYIDGQLTKLKER
ncbi:MAG: hypothetical protein Ta2D_05800 [Rickettsiales bacterium]|nr:MAG: hypothetical protein Ta2D_05800 [Rickettsiales bacterium]